MFLIGVEGEYICYVEGESLRVMNENRKPVRGIWRERIVAWSRDIKDNGMVEKGKIEMYFCHRAAWISCCIYIDNKETTI